MPPKNLDQHHLDRLTEPVAQGPRLARILLKPFLSFCLLWVRHAPRTCLLGLEQLGRTANRAGLIGPTGKEVAALLGPLPADRAAAVAADITGLSFKNELFMRMVIKKGMAAAEPFVRGNGSRQLAHLMKNQKGAVFFCTHTGPLMGVTAGFHKAGGPTLAIRAGQAPQFLRPGMEACTINTGPGRHAFVLKKALDALKQGRFVLMAFDATYGGAVIEAVPFMGRQFRFRRGLAMLARITGVPVFPVSATWIPGEGAFTFEVHPPLTVPRIDRYSRRQYDTVITKEAANWLEKRIRETPGQTQWHLLRQILRDG